MSLGDFLKSQFVDVIDWVEPADGTLAWRFPVRGREIQYGAQLTVRESQLALFINEGRAADAFAPGLHTLDTRTLPLLTALLNWDKAFESPFKSDVYFFSTRLQLAQTWGTPQPITVRDAEFGMVRLRGFGTYSYRIDNPLVFHQKVAGTRDEYRVEDLEPQLRSLVNARLAQALGELNVPFLDLAANLFRLGQVLQERLAPAFADLGLALQSFLVESVSLPEALQAKLDERIAMNMVGNLGDYAKYQAAQAIPMAAQNPGGGAGLGASMGVGMGLGQQMADALAPKPTQTPAPAPAAPAAPPASANDPNAPKA